MNLHLHFFKGLYIFRNSLKVINQTIQMFSHFDEKLLSQYPSYEVKKVLKLSFKLKAVLQIMTYNMVT